jgi:hypothetical protein
MDNRQPKKYAFITVNGDIVTLRHFATGEIYVPESSTRVGPHIHCPNPDYEVLLNGVVVEACDPSITPYNWPLITY